MSYMKYSVFTINGFHFMHVLHAVEKTAMLHVCVCVCVCVHACAMRACGVCMCMCVCVCVCVWCVCVSYYNVHRHCTVLCDSRSQSYCTSFCSILVIKFLSYVLKVTHFFCYVYDFTHKWY